MEVMEVVAYKLGDKVKSKYMNIKVNKLIFQ